MGEGPARTCPGCRREVQAEWKTCPWCSAVLPAVHGPLVRPCRSCGAMVWVAAANCARCGASTAVPEPVSVFEPQAPPPPEPEPEPEKPRRVRWRRLRSGLGDVGTAAALGITLALFAVVAGVGGVIMNWNSIGEAVGPSCSFGITGTAASITVHGWSSGDACKALRSSANFQTYDLPNEATSRPVICQYSVLNDVIVVHDETTGQAGGSLCAALHDALVTPRTSPTP